MCGRYVLGESSWAEYHDALSIITPEPTKPRFNIAPTQSAPICYASGDTLKSTDARWWFVPTWHKGDLKDWKATTFNAKIETAREKPTFRSAWINNRCIVPATGYYEWTGEKGSFSQQTVELPLVFRGVMQTKAEAAFHRVEDCTAPIACGT